MLRSTCRSISVQGEAHIANSKDPSIPSALVGVISGIISLHDFRPRPMHRDIHPAHIDPRSGMQTTQGTALASNGALTPNYTCTSGGSTYEAVTSGDLATIYNLNGLFAAGYSGQGQTIVVI